MPKTNKQETIPAFNLDTLTTLWSQLCAQYNLPHQSAAEVIYALHGTGKDEVIRLCKGFIKMWDAQQELEDAPNLNTLESVNVSAN